MYDDDDDDDDDGDNDAIQPNAQRNRASSNLVHCFIVNILWHYAQKTKTNYRITRKEQIFAKAAHRCIIELAT